MHQYQKLKEVKTSSLKEKKSSANKTQTFKRETTKNSNKNANI